MRGDSVPRAPCLEDRLTAIFGDEVDFAARNRRKGIMTPMGEAVGNFYYRVSFAGDDARLVAEARRILARLGPSPFQREMVVRTHMASFIESIDLFDSHLPVTFDGRFGEPLGIIGVLDALNTEFHCDLEAGLETARLIRFTESGALRYEMFVQLASRLTTRERADEFVKFLRRCQAATLLDGGGDPECVVELLRNNESVPEGERLAFGRSAFSVVSGRMSVNQLHRDSASRVRWPVPSVAGFLRNAPPSLMSGAVVAGTVSKSQVAALRAYDELTFSVSDPSQEDLLRVRDTLSVEEGAIDNVVARVGVMHALEVRWRLGEPTRYWANDGVALACNRRLAATTEIVPGHRELYLVLVADTFEADPPHIRERAAQIASELDLQIAWSHATFAILGGS